MQKFKFLSKDKKSNKNNSPRDDNELHDSLSVVSERKLVSRNAVICSSGKDKYRFDSERAELPTRPANFQLEADAPSLIASHHGSTSFIGASQHSLCNSTELQLPFGNHLAPTTSRETLVHGNVVKRDTVVKRFDLQPSVFSNGKFHNPWHSYKPPTFTNILKLGLSPDRSNVSPKQDLNFSLPLLAPNIQTDVPQNSCRVTWIGHSTVLAEFDNISVLTDPIFSERASPSQVFGPKRYRAPPCSIHDLPSNLDAVVISHSHYDHLDLNTVVMLNARFGNDLRWFIPIGLADWFNRVDVENVIELDWWEENCVPDKSDVSFIFTPCQHWSKRTLTDDNKSLWGSWVIKGPKFRFFFAGDTGYCDTFKQVGLMHGPFDVAAIPIGSYEPRWYMKHQHVNPDEAVKIHRDIKSRFSIGVHWGTFPMSNEYFLDPPIRLREALDKHQVSRKEFITFMHGETRIIAFDGKVTTTPRTRIL